MKKIVSVLVFLLIIFSLTACKGMYISVERYGEISNFVLKNKETLSSTKDIEFFDYETTGLSIGGAYYGYYYTVNNEITVPDFYSDGNLGEKYEADGGTYFGKPNNGTDWCFVKKITDNWYYYELHWG
ncbi:MAG: hypothetical protein IJ462_01930 [Clostridia bacterium]|nr:hypothetical protein [Clostridia bacterium]